MQAADFRDANGDPFKRRSTFHDMKSAMAQERRSNGYKVYAADPEADDEEESTAAKMEKMRKMRRSWGDSLGQHSYLFCSPVFPDDESTDLQICSELWSEFPILVRWWWK